MAREEQRDYGLPARRQESGLSGFGQPDYGAMSPFAMMRRMQEDMDRIWSQFFGSQGFGGQGFGGFGGMQAWSPNVDMHESEREFVVRADIPGVEPEDLEVLCMEDRLILRGEVRREEESHEQGRMRSERRYGRFERVLPLPGEVKQDQIQASFRNGVLELRLPKSEESRQRVRRIPIQGGGQMLSGTKGGEVTAAEHPSEQQAPAEGAGGENRTEGSETSRSRGRRGRSES